LSVEKSSGNVEWSPLPSGDSLCLAEYLLSLFIQNFSAGRSFFAFSHVVEKVIMRLRSYEE
jgi:hypothetical protein